MSEVEYWRRARQVRLYELSQHTLLYRIDDLLRLFTSAKMFSKKEMVSLRKDLEQDIEWLQENERYATDWIVRTDPVSFPEFAPTYSEALVSFARSLYSWADNLTSKVDSDDTHAERYARFQTNILPGESWGRNPEPFTKRLRAACTLEMRMASRMAEARAQTETD